MKKWKKTALTISSYVAVAALAIGGTMAFFTDRASVPNTFTAGNVDIEINESFEQGAKLMPGVYIEKKPTITNVGESDAWVWLTFSIPSAFDNFVQGTEDGSNENMIHWNPMGATTEGYFSEDNVKNAVEDGRLPAGTTYDDIKENNKTWEVFNSIAEGVNCYKEEIDNIDYNTYVLLYNKALEPGEETLPNITRVFLDSHIDIAPDGEMYRVEKGDAKELGWNINEDGAPIIYVNAYGIQKDNFASVDDAYDAYADQWADNGGAMVNKASSGTELTAASGTILINKDIALEGADTEIKNAANIILAADITADRHDASINGAASYSVLTVYNDVTLSGSGTVENTGSGYGVTLREEGADLTINGGTYKGDITAINVAKGNLTITGGFFEDTNRKGYYMNGDTQVPCENGHFLINCIDGNYKTGIATVTIKGGTFVNFDPSNNASEGAGTNFVADGYKVISEKQANGDVWYTVVAK